MKGFQLLLAAWAIVLTGGCSMTSDTSRPTQTPVASVANIGGAWHFVADTPSGRHEARMSVVQSGQEISGRFEGALGLINYAGTVDTDEVRFGHVAMAGSMRFDYVGTVESSNRMTGTAVFGTLGHGTWTATKMSVQ